MKTVTTTVYSYNELSASAQETAREWYRNLSSGPEWADSVSEDAKECGKLIGLDIEHIYWSGFCSQGDGACFTGSWRAEDVQPGKLAEHAPQDKELSRFAAEFERIALAYPEASFHVKHSGHYQHSGCTDFNFSFDDERESVEDAEEALTEVSRDFMNWIYRQLEAEYEYQNSDEQVTEAITANEYTFTEDGKRFKS